MEELDYAIKMKLNRKIHRYREIVKNLRKLGFDAVLNLKKVKEDDRNCIIIRCTYGNASDIIHCKYNEG